MTRPAAAQIEDLEDKRLRFLALARDIPEKCRLVELSEGSGLGRKIRKLRSFGRRYADVTFSRWGLRTPRHAAFPLFWGRPLRLPFSKDSDFVVFYLTGAPGGPEYKLVRYFIKTLGARDVFYDVGACYGFYTYLASEFVTKGEVHSFEPAPDVCRCIENNRLETERINNLALSDRKGPASLYIQDLSTAMSTLEWDVVAADPGRKKERKIEIQCTTLDDYIETHQAPTILKIDVEGAEGRLIEGGRRFFASRGPVVAMEVWGGESGRKFSLPVVRKMGDLGYRAHALLEDGGLTGPLSETEIESYLSRISWDNMVFKK